MLCLAITGFDVSPQRVTEILGIEPTSAHSAGDALCSGRSARTSAWHLTLSESQSITTGDQHHDLLQQLLAHLTDKQQNFATLHEQAKPKEVTIDGGLHVSRDEPSGIWLEPEQMEILAACGIGWSLDVFVAEETNAVRIAS
ncbi:DUF4279 domain-containing protein [Phenylobacterium sp.]|uniref:DUF4279 domain-containing protein n=1 Tax=Phenylobacterium sp. TaxID=1871053 RepID=UPI0019B44CF7|nr:DUF4279 domain-containing protein [Phenylobacterium sp.]MBC7167112.1 DUF4279 domain-containing protein [Phenylobacterium sp.]